MDIIILVIGSVSTACLVVVALVTLSWKFSQWNQSEMTALRESIDEIKTVLFEINGRLGRVEGRLGRVEGQLGLNPTTGGMKDSGS